MNKLKRFLRSNGVFILVVIITALTAVITRLSGFIGENPSSQEYELGACTGACFGEKINAFITEGGSTIAVTNSDNELLYKIHGDDPDRTFNSAKYLSLGENDDIYIIDVIYDDGGLDEKEERILKFSSGGRKREIIYSASLTEETIDTPDASNANNEQIKNYMKLYANFKLKNLMIMDGDIYFSQIDISGVTLKRIRDGEPEELFFMNFGNGDYIYETALYSGEKGTTYALSTKHGVVYTVTGNDFQIVWEASSDRKGSYPRIVQNVAFDSSGRLYLCDLGERVIRRYEDGKCSVFIPQNYFSDENPESFEYLPIYTTLEIRDDIITVVSVNSEEEYCVNAVDTDGNIIASISSVPLSWEFKVRCFILYFTMLLFVIVAVYSLARIVILLKKTHLGILESEKYSMRLKYAVLVVSFTVALITAFIIFRSSNELYHDKAMENIVNVSVLINDTIDDKFLKSVNSPADMVTEDYLKIDQNIVEYLHMRDLIDPSKAYCKDVYIIIYGIKNNVIYELYRDDWEHCIFYPLPGGYEGSVEQSVLESNQFHTSVDLNTSEGSFEYILQPCFDREGNPVALIEAGMAYDTFVQSNIRFFFQMMLIVFSGIIIVMLMFGEILSAAEAVRQQRRYHRKKADYSPSALRPLAFIVFFTANITTVFLPVYGTDLWNDKFPFPAEVGAAMPLSAELLVSALSSFITSRIIKKTGVKPICFFGVVFYILGNALSAFAWDLWALILANSICGVGGGMLIMGINYRITAFETEEDQNKGFVAYNAALLAGVNCGTVIGSLIWENFGYAPAFFTAAGCAVVGVAAVIYLLDRADLSQCEDEEGIFTGTGGIRALKKFFTPEMIKWLLFISIPYTICESFISYFYPIIAEDSGFSAAQISIAFLVSGAISIYTGSALGEYITTSLGAIKAMILASFIYASALVYFVLQPTAESCYVVIVLFAVADSFGISAHSVFFASSKETKAIGENRALGINGTIESITSSCGSLVFGGALMLGVRRGIMLVSLVFIAFLFLYVATAKREKSSENGSEMTASDATA